jgi:beta-lactamase regulating signal transducer with metallopeptidase domain
MKNQKNILIKLFILVLLMGIFNVPSAFALKRAIFPDAKSLQPIPTYTHPNISGNINSVTGVAEPTGPQSPTLNTENNLSNPSPQKEIPANNSMVLYVIWLAIAFIIIFLAIFIYRKIKRGKEI